MVERMAPDQKLDRRIAGCPAAAVDESGRSAGRRRAGTHPLRSGYLLLALGFLIWTAAVGASLWSGLVDIDQQIFDVARVQAVSEWRKDVLYRRWNALHSPVYVPSTESTPPNPLLADIPDRDITTPSGQRLTLVNPAYMTRQVHELGAADDVHGHITSLRPIRPQNAPDAWERAALMKLEAGSKEYWSVEQMPGGPHLRFMRPLVTEVSCLRCHARQGYRVGDLRGGLAVAISLEPLSAAAFPHRRAMIIRHLLIWSLGVIALLFGGRMHLAHVREGLALEAEKVELEKLLSEGRRLEAVGTLAGGIAHQFNNLIMMIMGYTELALDHRAGDRRLAQNLERILSACGRAATLVEKMSLLAHHSEALTGSALVKETLDRVVAPLREHLPARTALREDVPPEASVAMASSDLETVLRHLLSNAADAVGETGGEILVKAEPCVRRSDELARDSEETPEEQGVRIVVEDTGPGIEPEVLRRVFEPFFTTKDVGRGEGLGLSVARAIVQRHGGHIEIQALPTRGTSVEVWLKAA